MVTDLKEFSVALKTTRLTASEVKPIMERFNGLCKMYGIPTKYWNGSGTNYGISKKGECKCSASKYGKHFKSLDEFEEYLTAPARDIQYDLIGTPITDRALLHHGMKVILDHYEKKDIEGVISIPSGEKNPNVYICTNESSLNGSHPHYAVAGYKYQWSTGGQDNSGMWDGVRNLRPVGHANKSSGTAKIAVPQTAISGADAANINSQTLSNEVFRKDSYEPRTKINGSARVSKLTKSVATGIRPVGNTATVKLKRAGIRSVAISKRVIFG